MTGGLGGRGLGVTPSSAINPTWARTATNRATAPATFDYPIPTRSIHPTHCHHPLTPPTPKRKEDIVEPWLYITVGFLSCKGLEVILRQVYLLAHYAKRYKRIKERLQKELLSFEEED